MGKISPVSSKYVINASILIEGVVDRPDVIGAIFGQTEGLLGADLELRELQRSGRIGRIEVNVDTKSGKTSGVIVIPSSLDKAETAIVAAALEIIKRIGPCNAKVRVQSLEDVRVSKRQFVIERAKQLLKNLMEQVMPDSQELSTEVAHSVRVMEICTYGRDTLAAGPNIEDNDEIIICEGRADVLNLLKYGFKNAIAMNGTSVPNTIIELAKHKSVTVFVDGDRGGGLILKELMAVADIDYVAIAPDGKEVEELTQKELHKALRSRVSAEQAASELKDKKTLRKSVKKQLYGNKREPRGRTDRNDRTDRAPRSDRTPRTERAPRAKRVAGKPLSDKEKGKFKELLEGLVGTRGAYLIDDQMNIMGKVPYAELANTIDSLKSGVYAVIFDGTADKKIADVADRARVKHIIAMDNKSRGSSATVTVASDL
jgi:DNA primase